MANEEVTFEAENFRGGKDAFSYKSLVLNQVSKVMQNASKEFKEGFFIYSESSNQTAQKLRYIEDTRETYFNSVNVLHDILLPKFDDEMQKQGEELNLEIEELRKTAVENIKSNLDKRKSLERTYFEDKIVLYRRLFQKLSLFLERQGWLEAEYIDD